MDGQLYSYSEAMGEWSLFDTDFLASGSSTGAGTEDEEEDTIRRLSSPGRFFDGWSDELFMVWYYFAAGDDVGVSSLLHALQEQEEEIMR